MRKKQAEKLTEFEQTADDARAKVGDAQEMAWGTRNARQSLVLASTLTHMQTKTTLMIFR